MSAAARPLEVGALGVIRPPVDDLLEATVRLERAGFDAVWWSDHFLHWVPPGTWTPDHFPQAATARTPHVYLDPMPIIAAAGERTERIRLGTGVTDPIRRHPAVLAQTFLTLDHLTAGRALLGIGVGEAENILPFGLPYDRTASRLIEALEVIRLLWSTDELVSYTGEHFRLDDAILGLRPYADEPPPIWVAGHRPRVLAATGRLGDGWMPISLDAEEYAAGLAAIRAASVAAGRPADAVRAGQYVWVVAAEDRARAERMLDTTALRFIALTAPTAEFETAGVPHPLAQRWGLTDFVPTTLTREEGLRAAAAVPDEVLRRYYFWGTPDDVVARLAPFRAAGLEHADLVNMAPLADPSCAATAGALLEEIQQGLRALP